MAHDETLDDDSLLREIAAAPPIAVPRDVATYVLLEPGTVIDEQFRIEARLGAGGMGVVYEAVDLRLQREVALKLMRLDRAGPQLGDRLPEVFEREARATAKLNHPNIVTLHQFGNWNGLLYLVLERLRGETLHARMARTTVTLVEGLEVMELVAQALVHTHAAGITHRDLKPQNVFLLAGGGVKVLDFGVSGLARIGDATPAPRGGHARSTLSLAGTPGYMAPEQWDGLAQDARTDLFAMGVMLYQLATGKLPFGSVPIDLGARAPSLAGHVPAEVADLVPLVASLLALRPADRLPSARELVDRLAAIRRALPSDSTASAVHGGGSLATARVHPRRRSRRFVAGAALAVAAGAVALQLRGDGRTCDARPLLVGVWDVDTRAALAARFGDTARRDAIVRAVDTYANQWTSLHDGACRADDTPAATCLEDRRLALARTTTALWTLEADVALTAVRGLPALADCSDPAYLARMTAPTPPRVAGALAPFALALSGYGRDNVHSIAFVDDDLVISGYASNGAALPGAPLAAPPNAPKFGFVARLGRDGTVRWTQVFDRAWPLALAMSGDAVVAGGSYDPGARIGDVAAPPSVNRGQALLARLDVATGAVRRVDALATHGVLHALRSDADGNLYGAGEWSDTSRFGGDTAHTIVAPTRVSFFVASWTPEGRLRWVHAARGLASSKMWAIAVDGDSVAFAAYVLGSGTLAGREIGAQGCLVGRVARATGEIAWLRGEGTYHNACVPEAIAMNGERIALAGRHHAERGGFVAELARHDGARRWVRPLGTAEHDRPKVIAFGPRGEITVGGWFTESTMTAGGTGLVSNGGLDAFVATFDPAGNGLGAIAIGGAGTDTLRTLQYDAGGRLWIGGRFEGALRVGDRSLTAVAEFDGYLAELSPRLFTPPPAR